MFNIRSLTLRLALTGGETSVSYSEAIDGDPLLGGERKPDNRVLAPLKDPNNVALVRLGALIARERKASLLILHVIEVPLALPPKSITFDYVEEQIEALRRTREAATEMGVDTSILVKIAHKVHYAIQETMREEDPEALVLGWDGRHFGRGGRIFGDSIDLLVSVAKCDVMVLQGRAIKEKLASLTVLSSRAWHATHAAEVAALLAEEHAAVVVILSVIQRKAAEGAVVADGRRLMKVLEKRGVPSRHEIAHSRSVVEVVAEQASRSDLLVLGANPRVGLRKHHFGALEGKIAKRVSTPVLMFRKWMPRSRLDERGT